MNSGTKYKFGDIVLAIVPFINTLGAKTRPVFVLFEEKGNVVASGITSNLEMEGIPITKQEGMLKDSIIKTNYLVTISKEFIRTKLMEASKEKKKVVREEIINKLE